MASALKPLFAVLCSWYILVAALEPAAIEEECSNSGESVAFLQVSVESAARRGKDHTICPASPASIADDFAAQAAATGSSVHFVKQIGSCMLLGTCVDSSNKASQDEWRKAGAIQAVVATMRNFPDDKDVQVSCLLSLSGAILFNRESGLLAGQLGALNTTWNFYSKHMDDPEVTSLGGAIGAFFDYVNENRDIARELGIIPGLIQNIRNNFHGKYGEWNVEPVKNSLFALSSGAWKNQDLVVEAGFIPLDVALIAEHGHEAKIAEESLQVVKSLTFASDDLRHQMSEAGLFKVLAQVLRTRSFDRGAVSLVCDAISNLIGPNVEGAATGGVREIPFDAAIQERAVKDGVLEAVLARAMSTEEMQHFEHGSFNFNIDQAYPAQLDCYSALKSLAQDNPGNQQSMIKAGLVQSIGKKWESMEENAKPAACRLVAMLNEKLAACSSLVTEPNSP